MICDKLRFNENQALGELLILGTTTDFEIKATVDFSKSKYLPRIVYLCDLEAENLMLYLHHRPM